MCGNSIEFEIFIGIPRIPIEIFREFRRIREISKKIEQLAFNNIQLKQNISKNQYDCGKDGHSVVVSMHWPHTIPRFNG